MPLEGFLLVDKPVGLTSFQVVKKVKYLSGQKKTGHAGTLDPFATGLLVLALGRPFTKHIDRIQEQKKVYDVTMVLGKATDTYDCDGIITAEVDPSQIHVSDEAIYEAITTFIGTISQIPPVYSAKKINGKRAYDLARKGEDVVLKPVTITIESIENVRINRTGAYPEISFRVRCSKGTYIRSLVYDIGQSLGFPAYTQTLRREAIGEMQAAHALSFETLSLEGIQKALQCQVPSS